MQRSKYLSLVVIIIIVLWIYLPSLSFWAVHDDFNHLLKHFTSMTRSGIISVRHFRPIEDAINSLNISLLSYHNLVLSQSLNLAGFLLSILCIYKLGQLLQPDSPWTAIFSTALFAFSPVPTASVIQIDTISQQYATVFILLCLIAFISYRSLWPGYLCAFLAMLSKETALGIIPAIPLPSILIRWEKYSSNSRNMFKDLLNHYAIVLFLFFTYFGLRVANGVPFTYSGHHRYDLMGISPVNMIKNAVLFFGNIMYAGSSLHFFPNIQTPKVILSVILTLVLLIIGGIGFIHLCILPIIRRNSSFTLPSLAMTVWGLLLLMLAGFFPAGLLKSISELYCYSSFPFFVLLLGVVIAEGLGQLKSHVATKQIIYKVAIVFSIMLLLWLLLGTREKVILRSKISEQSRSYFKQTVAFLTTVPTNEITLCWSPEYLTNKSPRYSVFILPDRSLLSYQLVDFSGFVTQKSARMLAWRKSDSFCDYDVRINEGIVNFIKK